MLGRHDESHSMPQDGTVRRRTSLSWETGTYVPRQFSTTARYRFLRDRRRHHLSRVPGAPSPSQTALALSLARLEWGALKAESMDTLQGDREGREFRRLFQRLLGEFEETLPKPVSEPPPKPVAAVLADMRR